VCVRIVSVVKACDVVSQRLMGVLTLSTMMMVKFMMMMGFNYFSLCIETLRISYGMPGSSFKIV